MSRIALALLLSVAGLGAVQAAPAEPLTGSPTGPAAEPLPAELCGTLKQDFAAALRFPLAAGIGAPTIIVDTAPAGTGCFFSGRATGLKHRYGDALGRLEKLVEGWESIPEFAADGADSTVQGYRKGDRQIIFALDVEPPAGTCRDVVQSSCRVPAQRWQWTFKAVAYRK